MARWLKSWRVRCAWLLNGTRAAVAIVLALALSNANAPAALAAGDKPLPTFLDNKRLPILEAAQREADEKAKLEKQEQDKATERRKAAETRARSKAEELSRKFSAPAGDDSTAPDQTTSTGSIRDLEPPTLTTVPPISKDKKTGAKTCAPADVKVASLPGAQVRIDVTSPCRASQEIVFSYSDISFAQTLDAKGKLETIIDLFLGPTAGLKITFTDGHEHALTPNRNAFKGIIKTALIWKGPVNLDLHAFEYASPPGKSGHIWSGTPSSPKASRAAATPARGRGFLTTINDKASAGHTAEIYTFVRAGEQQRGIVTMALDYHARGDLPSGDYCGAGQYASIAFEVVILDHSGAVRRERGLIPSADCGKALKPGARKLTAAIPDLRVR